MGQTLGRTRPCARIPNARRANLGIAGLGAALLALTLTLALPSPPAKAEGGPVPSATRALASRGAADPIRAWVQLCRDIPEECGVDVGERSVINLTQELWDLVVSVNREVNQRIMAISDRDHWGVEDRWNYPDDGAGDCEDIQLLKRKLLIERGLPRRALRMTVVIDEEGAGHAVMMVRTDRGDFILDNRRMSVLPWTQTGYVYVKAEGQDGKEWMSLGGATMPIMTAKNDEAPAPARVASR
jgi:predicted transglutaminase-like cysteine proteinase